METSAYEFDHRWSSVVNLGTRFYDGKFRCYCHRGSMTHCAKWFHVLPWVYTCTNNDEYKKRNYHIILPEMFTNINYGSESKTKTSHQYFASEKQLMHARCCFTCVTDWQATCILLNANAHVGMHNGSAVCQSVEANCLEHSRTYSQTDTSISVLRKAWPRPRSRVLSTFVTSGSLKSNAMWLGVWSGGQPRQ